MLFAVIALPASAGAQQPVSDHALSSGGPRVELTATAMHTNAAAVNRDAALAAAARNQGLGKPVALMLVGGGALLAGLIIGGDAGTVIAIAGVVIGLIGLYQYLQ
jgi:hypothetical protein